MATPFAVPRHARVILAFLVLFLGGGGARRGCAATAPCRDAVGSEVGGHGAGAATLAVRRPPPSSIACRRIPPPSRRSRFPAARSPSPRPRVRSACSTTRASRRPISPIPPISSTAPIARTRPVTFLFNGGPGAASAWLQFGSSRTVAAGHQRRRGDAFRVARSAAQRRDLARLHRSRLHRSRRHRLQPLRRDRRGRAQAVLFGRRRRQLDRGDDPPLAGKIRSPAVAEIRRRRKLWRHPRTEDRAQSADPSRASA